MQTQYIYATIQKFGVSKILQNVFERSLTKMVFIWSKIQ